LLDRILDRLDADQMTLFTVINSPLNKLLRCLHTSSSFIYGVVLGKLTGVTMKKGTTGISTCHIAILIVWQRCKRYDPIKLSQSPA
jgi:hypothetical protein